MSKMKEWEIHSECLKGHLATDPKPHIDVVFFEENMTEEEVRKILIDWNGYPEDIEVYDAKKDGYLGEVEETG